MCLELEILSKNYLEKKKNNPNLYKYEEKDIEYLEYGSYHKEGLSLGLNLIKVNNSYKIFYIVSKLDKLILMYPIEESELDLTSKYKEILNHLNILNVDEFVFKYCR